MLKNYENKETKKVNVQIKIAQYLIIVWCAFFIISPTLYAQSLSATTPEQSVVDEASARTMMNQAEKLFKKGEFFKAREIYQNILSSPNIGQISRSELQEKVNTISMQILFSNIKTDESLVHIVQPGDSLHKIAKKYGTTIELLQKTNGVKGSKIHPGDELKVVKGTFSVFVDKSDNTLDLQFNGTTIKQYRVATGKNNCSPVGSFVIKNKLVDPTWYHEGAVVPADSPDNILGTRWMGFDIRGYGIHGTTIPQSIGTQDTAGCVRMYNHEVEELYAILPVGTKVVIVD
jgi:lipoprotein-anchoring transpeptidase ErfK/SrfK